MSKRPANDEMVRGYLDGLDMSSPEPSENRSYSYRHGFAAGRSDRGEQPPWHNATEGLMMADEAMARDDDVMIPRRA